MKHSSKKIAILTAGLVLAVALPIAAHTALRSSVPAKDAHLAAPPTELHLTFTTAVDPQFARVQLLGSDSLSYALGSLRAGAAATDLVAPVVAALNAGTYTVTWQVLGTDGHPVRGRFSFVIDPPVVDTTAVVNNPDPAGVTPGTPPEITEPAGLESPSFVATRWLTFAALLSLIGAAAFRWLVLVPAERRDADFAPVAREAAQRAATLGRGAALFLALAAVVRLLLQLQVLREMGTEQLALQRMMLETSWGRGWLLQMGGALLALGGFQLAQRSRASGWTLAIFACLAVSVGAALSGHSAAVEGWTAAAVASDAVHVLAVSAWLGTLVVLMGAGIPTAMRDDRPGATRLADVAVLISTFSPRALIAAGIVAVTGVFNAILHFHEVAELWQTDYGRALLLKLAVVLLVVGLGAYNWQRVKPRLVAGADPRNLRTSATLELLGGALVLLITAVLVALPTP